MTTLSKAVIDRRKFLYGAASLFAAPAIIRSGVLMPVKRLILPPETVFGPGDSLDVYFEEASYYWDWEMVNGLGYLKDQAGRLFGPVGVVFGSLYGMETKR
jgi:hypothetical protein